MQHLWVTGWLRIVEYWLRKIEFEFIWVHFPPFSSSEWNTSCSYSSGDS